MRHVVSRQSVFRRCTNGSECLPLLADAADTAAVAQQPAQAAGQAQLDPYKKAFSVCMEGKGYTAK